MEVRRTDEGWVIGYVKHRDPGLQYTAPLGVFGILFRPCGFFHLLGVPLSDAEGPGAAADDTLGRFGRALTQHVAALDTHVQRVAAAEELMIGELHRRKAQLSVVNGVITSVLQRHGQVHVDEMAQEANMSRRQLERRFLEAVGVPPKLFAEMNRFAYVFRLMHEQPRAKWSDVTYACGYFDQAHFIREFRRFTGETPGAYFTRVLSLT
jgi:AraC-like DNA-binding protein